MNQQSRNTAVLFCLALAAVAFLVFKSLDGEVPVTGVEADSPVAPVVDAPVDSPAAEPVRMLANRKPSTAGGAPGSARVAVPSELVPARIVGAMQGVVDAKAAQREQIVRNKEEFKALVMGLTAGNARSIAETIEKKLGKGTEKSNEMRSLYMEFYSAWGALAGADAMAFSNEVGGDGQKEIFEAWAKSDFDAAKAYAVEQRKLGKEGVLSQSIMQRIIVERLAEENIEEAIAYSMKNETESAASGYSGASTLAKKIFEKRGLAGIESWFSRVEGSFGADESRNYRTHVAVYGLETIARENPARAREWLVKMAARGAMNAGSMNRLATEYGLAKGPEDELAMIAAAIPADTKDAGRYSELVADRFAEYLKRDFAAAGAWLAKQPRDARNDGAIQKFALAAAGTDREAALQWAQQISDERLREATLARPEFTGTSSVIRPRKP